MEAGVYYSQAYLDSQNLVLPEAASTDRQEVLPRSESTLRAIGMAALPEGSLGEQLTSLVYQGMTSADYAQRHQAWLNSAATREQLQRDIQDQGLGAIKANKYLELGGGEVDSKNEEDEDEKPRVKKSSLTLAS